MVTYHKKCWLYNEFKLRQFEVRRKAKSPWEIMSAQVDSDSFDGLHKLVRGGLAGWGLSPDSELSLLTVSENATFKANDARTGRTLAIRLHRIGYHTPLEIESELSWISALRAQGVVDTPAPIIGLDGKAVRRLGASDGTSDRLAVAFEFVAGSEPDATNDLTEWFCQLGRITARMHRHAKQWRPPPSFQRKTWDFNLMFGPHPIWGRWQDGPGLDDQGRSVLTRAVETIRQRLRRFGNGRDRFGLIHADLRLANLLVDRNVLRVIDFDDCGFSWFVYDFASAVSFFEKDPIVPTLAAAWVEGYRSVASLDAEEETEISVFVMLRRILLVAWIATHQHSPMGGDFGIRYTRDSVDMAEAFLTGFA